MGHACAHTWATWKQQWGMHARIHGPYMGAYMGHMGAAMGHACAHTWPYMGQPYRESREEGNNRESLPFPRSGKGITPGLSFPFPSPSSREGKGREGKVIPTLFRSVSADN